MLEVNNLSKNFGSKTIFSQLSFYIKKGEMVALVGPSGCGKSTLLNILGLIEDFQAGDYSFDGLENIKVNSRHSEKVIREKISYLFQNFALIETETVEKNLLLAMTYVKMNKKEKLTEIAKVLEKVGLKGYENRKIYELSGGEQQRVALARAILKPSELILADEPTGSLDRENKWIVMNLLKELNESGKTVVVVTHDEEIANSCDRTISLH